jgi:nucleoid DNA-binding protein
LPQALIPIITVVKNSADLIHQSDCQEPKAVTKKEIVKRISDSTDELTQLKAKEIVQKTLDTIIQALTEEPHRIELRNFGVFEVRRRKPRVARNPRTNVKVNVPAKNVVTFKPGKEMEDLIQKINEGALAEASTD